MSEREEAVFDVHLTVERGEQVAPAIYEALLNSGFEVHRVERDVEGYDGE